MRVKMLLMAGAALFKASHRPQACSRRDPVQAWVSFPHVGEGEESRPSRGSVLCLLCKVSRLCFQSLMWKNNPTARCGWWATQGAGWSWHSMALPVTATRVLLPLVLSLPAPCPPARGTTSRDRLCHIPGGVSWVHHLGRDAEATCVCLLATRANGKTKQSLQFWRAFRLTVFILFFGPMSSKALRHVLKVKACA